MAKLRRLLEHLAGDNPHPQQYQDHPLLGNHAGARDCHVEPDWVLIYAIVGEELRLLCTGTHADLFKKIIAQVPDTFQVAGTFYTS